MKKDQYIPHEISMRNTSEVMNLIENEGMEGYGIYWAIMEYLRVQDGYTGDIQSLKSLARQLRVRLPKLKRIMENYGLFSCTETTFLSPKLVEVMKPFEDRRARIEAYKRDKQKQNSLVIRDVSSKKSDIVSFEVKGKGEGKGKEERKTTSSLKEKDDDGLVPVSITPAWERYVDELRHEQSWIEIMAMRSGLGKAFVQRFGEVLQLFKEHVQAVAHESHVVSSSEAKRYFCFFNTPGSATFQKLVDEFHKPADKGKYKHEDRDPLTKQFPVPTMYDISGSAAFFNKADFGIAIERDRTRGITRVHVQKVKFRHLGQPGIASFQYNTCCGRFVPMQESKTPDIPDEDPKWDNSNWLAKKLPVQGEIF